MSCLDSEPDACYLAMHTSRNSFQWRFAVKGDMPFSVMRRRTSCITPLTGFSRSLRAIAIARTAPKGAFLLQQFRHA